MTTSRFLTHGLRGFIGAIFNTSLVGVSFPVFASEAATTQPGAKYGQVSWYSTEACRVNPDPSCPTASGTSLHILTRSRIPYLAMWHGHFGSKWRLCGTAGCAEAVLLDRGPAKRFNRLADTAPWVFEKVCGNISLGICQVTLERVK